MRLEKPAIKEGNSGGFKGIGDEANMAKVQIKKLTGFQKTLLDMVRSAEDVQIAYYRRKHISRRALRFAGKLGVDEDEGVGAIRRKILVSPKYALELLHALHDENLLSKTKLDKYTLSQEAIESVGYLLRRRGYIRSAVSRLLRRDLAKRGFIKALREHKPPRKTTVIPPIIGYFK